MLAMIGLRILLVTVLGAFAAGTGLYAIWCYRHDSYFRNDVKLGIFTVATRDHNRKLLLLGDSRIEFLECAQELVGWATLNLGVSGMTSDRLVEFVVSRRNALTSFDAIVLWIGVNDILRGRPVADASSDILSILRELEMSTIPIALVEQIHVVNSANQVSLERANVELTKLNGTFTDAFDSARVTIIKPFRDIPLGAQSTLYSDSVHLNDQGNKVICSTLDKWLATL
jgi:lysophospholipase L1-like esterase